MEGTKKRKSENGHGDCSRKKIKVRVVYLRCFEDCRRIKAILRYPEKVSILDLLTVLTNDQKQWIVPKKGQSFSKSTAASIEPGDVGIWATCEMHKEGKCIAELNDLFDDVRASS